MELANSIRELFVRMGYKWRFNRGGESVLDTPTVEDVDSMIKTAADRLDSSGGSWIESGRILIKSDSGFKDVYVHMGTINNEENDNDSTEYL